MAKRKMIDEINSDAAANPGNSSDQNQTAELPFFQSPSVSPAKDEPEESHATDLAQELHTEIQTEAAALAPPVTALTMEGAAAPAGSDDAAESSTARVSIMERMRAGFARMPRPKLRPKLRPRHRRYAVLAASVTIAAAIGAVAGIAATGGLSRSDVTAAVQENRAAQESIARLSMEITGLKASLEAANKSAHAQFTKLSDRLNREGAEITGSIAPLQTVPPSAQASAPLPASRPPGTVQPARPSVVMDWSIREMRDGYIYVQGHGDIYQVVPGAPLPGLGPVEQIRRQDGRWVVVTPKGIIVSMRDRRYFEQF
ncbi:MAG TPA: hypothetical protein VJR71_05800 [Pseudolabrys sp.]|nr:hypothetical protein [Pseudolabrys sp.]